MDTQKQLQDERFGKALTDAGYIAYANDHRGHGNTAKTLKKLGHPGDDAFNGIVKNLKQLNNIRTSILPHLFPFLDTVWAHSCHRNMLNPIKA